MMKKTIGILYMDYSVTCPHCEYTFIPEHDDKWWNENLGSDFESNLDEEFNVKCSECNEEFIIQGFQQ